MNRIAAVSVCLFSFAGAAFPQVYDPVEPWIENPSLGPFGRNSVTLQFNRFFYDPRVNSFESSSQQGNLLVTGQSRFSRSIGAGFWYAKGSNVLRQKTTDAQVEFDSRFFEVHGTWFIRMPSLENTLGFSIGYLEGHLSTGTSRSTGRWLVPYLSYSRIIGDSLSSRWKIGASFGYAFTLDQSSAESAVNYALSASYDLNSRLHLVTRYYVLDLDRAARITRFSVGLGYNF